MDARSPTSPGAPAGPLDAVSRALRAEMATCPSSSRLPDPDLPPPDPPAGPAAHGDLDDPLPDLLRETLFVYLSRFSPARCHVARHAVFLTEPRKETDPAAPAVPEEEVLALLEEPVPSPGETPALLAELESSAEPLRGWPELGSRAGYLLRIACARVLLEPVRAADWCRALLRRLGPRRYEQLALFLTFVRAAHFWTDLHPDLHHDEETGALLAGREALARAIGEGEGDAAGALRGDGLPDDLAELRHAGALADALRKSEVRFRKIFENAATGIAITDWEGTFQLCNLAYTRLVGYTEDELRRLRFVDLVHPDDREQNLVELGRLHAGEIPSFEVENRYVRKDGEPVWVHKFVSILPDETGTPANLFTLITNVTERREAETALRESELFYRGTLESIPGMTFTSTPDGMCDYVSEHWAELTGAPASELLGLGWIRFVHPDDRARALSARRDAVESRSGQDFEARIRRRDGQYEWFKIWSRPIRDASGTIVRRLGTAVNVDGLKRREAALRESEERLREADHRKDEFLATLAHELRNPLAPLRSGMHVLRRSKGRGPAAERALAIMDRQLGQMVRLVDDLLDLGRIRLGKVTLRKERVPLEVAVRHAVETSRPIIEQSGHELRTLLPAEPIEVEGDPARLAQVLSNLLNNAAKFTERGGRIELSVEQRGGEVLVTVRDSGVGIPAAMLDRVFEMFTQVGSSLERSQGGLGIGLSLVKQLVELHGGSVEAQSDGPGLGSVFTVHLPATPRAAAEGAADPAPRSPSPRSILVVDDNEDAAFSLAMLLAMTGHRTATAHDGVQALAVAEEMRPEVILLDLGMPGMNGYDVARELRRRPWGRDVVLIALTGWGQEEDRRRSREAGFDHHLVKPVDLADLEALLPA